MADEVNQTVGRELARTNGRALAQPTFPDPMQLGPVFAQSGMFKDATDPAKAIVKIIAGQELGLGPMASMTGIHMIEGKPTLSANLLATQVKRHPAYDYIVREHEDDVCLIEFFQRGESIGESKFDHADAVKAGVAGKQNYKRYPKAMMFARALSQGVRWYCPDVTAGTPAYVPEELGAEVNEDGEPVALPEPEVLTPDAVEDPKPARISEADVKALLNVVKAAGVKADQVKLKLTNLGVEEKMTSVAQALGLLTKAQADEFFNWLQEQKG